MLVYVYMLVAGRMPNFLDYAALLYMHTKGLMLRIDIPIQLILHPVASNSHKECFYA